ATRGGGKIPLGPNYLISASNDSVVLRNYEGMIIHYHPTGEPPARPSPVDTQGVSGLLEGQAEVLIPEGNPRHARRARASKNGHGFLPRGLDAPPDLVWNMAEGQGVGRCREARVPAVLEMLGIPYTGSDPLTLAAALDKDVAKRLVYSDRIVQVPDGSALPPG